MFICASKFCSLQEKITLRYFVKYQVVDGEEITELGEVGFPTALE